MLGAGESFGKVAGGSTRASVLLPCRVLTIVKDLAAKLGRCFEVYVGEAKASGCGRQRW